jgi:hypothetical protein
MTEWAMLRAVWNGAVVVGGQAMPGSGGAGTGAGALGYVEQERGSPVRPG